MDEHDVCADIMGDGATDENAADETMVARAFLYRLFQSLMSEEPTQQNVELLCSDTFADAMELCNASLDATERRTLEDAWVRNKDGLLDAGASQYTRLFYGPNKLAAPPWESSYVNPDRKIFQKATIDVRRCYAAQGLRPHMVNKIPDDHISIELGFMAEMARRMAEGQDTTAAAEASRAFLDDHVLRWLPRYVRDVLASEPEGLYRFVVESMELFISSDNRYLHELERENE